jgi:hypothetical protein
MKRNTICKLVSLVLAVAATQSSFARGGGGGGGGGFHGGGGFGGGGFHSSGGGGFHSFGGARPGFGGTRFAFGARPSFGRPVYVRPSTGVARAGVRTPAYTGARSSASRSLAANRSIERAGTHVYARQNGSLHRDWDRRSSHYWNGHWWAWNDGYWIGLDDGYYPWDYFPYYAYDYYPYDYYPGYYADVEPYYNNDDVYDGVPASDPNVTAVQQDLSKLGYYRGSIDGLYGRTTRDAVARYQAAKKFSVTGTLTRRTLQSLGMTEATAS